MPILSSHFFPLNHVISAWFYTWEELPFPVAVTKGMEEFFGKVGRQLRVVSFSIVTDGMVGKEGYFNDDDLDLVTRSCPNLTRLDLPRENKITAKGWRLLAIRCMQLEMLSVGKVTCTRNFLLPLPCPPPAHASFSLFRG